MLPERLTLAQQYRDDAAYLLAADRLASAVSRAYYAAYQAMWAALGDPPQAEGWRHGAIIQHFVRGYWFAPSHPATGPGLLESLRFGLRRLYDLRLAVDYDALPVSRASVETALQTVHQTLAAIDQHTPGEPL
ncbi:MAG: hypothetical protein AB7N91_33155 [Candidatus Tectimicrobiota bacterium]